MRRTLRRNRRYRNTPYRKCRPNRQANTVRIPPSTKARWGAKLRILRFLTSILPITIVNVEDIKAVSKEGKTKWNSSFSPLECGKSWFYSEIEKLNVQLVKTEGHETKKHRDKRGFAKSKAKLDYKWEAHNSDSHSLAEIVLGTDITPYLGIWKLEFHQKHRRQLHIQNFAKGGVRKLYGGTVSLGLVRFSTARYRNKLVYVGGTMNSRLSVHNPIDKKRLTQTAKKEDIQMLYTTGWRVQFLPRLKPWVSLHIFS